MRIILRALLGTPVLFASLLAIFPCVNPAPALAGTTTLVTYYPAPNGNYSQVTLYPQTQPSGVCRSGAMYVDNTSGAFNYCVDSNINPNGGALIGGVLAGTGVWGNLQTVNPVHYYDVANKGYVDAATSGVTYEGTTSSSYAGNCGSVTGGIFSCNAACRSNFPGSHMCTEGEVVRSGLTSSPFGWLSCDSYTQIPGSGGDFIDICSGVTGYITAQNPGKADCNGWTTADPSSTGPVMINGIFSPVTCSQALRINCCK